MRINVSINILGCPCDVPEKNEEAPPFYQKIETFHFTKVSNGSKYWFNILLWMLNQNKNKLLKKVLND